jgi:hypothetical protein
MTSSKACRPDEGNLGTRWTRWKVTSGIAPSTGPTNSHLSDCVRLFAERAQMVYGFSKKAVLVYELTEIDMYAK